MPALMAHELLGEAVAPQLPAGLVDGEEERIAFLIGCQGPDPFFFRWSNLNPKKIAATNRVGGVMHASRMSAFFDRLRDACKLVPQADQPIARAFALGMLCHYALDRKAHPFIYAKEYELLRAGTGLEHSGSQVHAVIESELDAALLWRLHQQSVAERTPESVLPHTPRTDRVAGSLLSQAVLAVYDLSIEPGLYGTCVSDMKLLYRILEPQGSLAEGAVRRLEMAVRKGGHSLVSGLAHPVVSSAECPAVNAEHAEWHDVWTGTASTDSFFDRWDEAAEGYPALAAAFLDGTPGEELTGHLNYSGVYMEDEATEIPEPEV